MDASHLDILKSLLKDSAQIKARQELLLGELAELENRLFKLENPQPGILGADEFRAYGQGEQTEILLDLPLSKLLDIYQEAPSILEPLCQRAALLPETDILERNALGNYWVLQLENQGFYLLPRPGDMKRLAQLESLARLFELENGAAQSREDFSLQRPAILQLLQRHRCWQLEEKGSLAWGPSPLGWRWHEQLQNLRNQYIQLLEQAEESGRAGLQALMRGQAWQQALERRYGELVTLMLNTCMPLAYAIYKGPILVPCNITLGDCPQALPAWDHGLPWDSTPYGQSHGKLQKDYRRTPPDHPLLPNQIYLKETHHPQGHTWAIAKSYAEASALVAKLQDHWGPLD
ncbi:MAG: hypothetical protein ACK5CA_08450 [Cyanobacteriota bacterium]|jgi:hypothetical protein